MCSIMQERLESWIWPSQLYILFIVVASYPIIYESPIDKVNSEGKYNQKQYSFNFNHGQDI